MRATVTLFQRCARLTFFTRPNCSLCDEAKLVVSKVWNRRPFEYDEINVLAPKQDLWKSLYEFDTPVVHFDCTEENNQSFETTAAARKLMHRFTEEDVESAIDEAMKDSK